MYTIHMYLQDILNVVLRSCCLMAYHLACINHTNFSNNIYITMLKSLGNERELNLFTVSIYECCLGLKPFYMYNVLHGTVGAL